jgi:nicotinate-nucleotide pyrophosphorylase (carboxylating)
MTSTPSLPPRASWLPLVELALSEDIGSGDITTRISISAGAEGRARIESRQPLVVCGLAVAEEVFHQVEPKLRFEAQVADGESVGGDTALAIVSGPVRGILAAERTALNFLARLCGIASFTRRFVEAVRETRAAIVDTRKTLPGWRALDKYAVAVGGGTNHRFGLYDGILLKDNHIAAAGGVEAAVKAARTRAPAGLRVQVEVQSDQEAEAAIGAGADFLLLDNCPPQRIEQIVERWGDRVLLEASGGIHLENLRSYAETGVARISIGALTHSPPAADLALEMMPGGVAA